MPECFTEGVIILITKDKQAKKLDQFRPITLLNSDYKILTKILTNRLNEIMEKIIRNEQNCGNEKSIFNALMLNRDVVMHAQNKKFIGALLSLDFKPAFDRVSHEFLWKILEKFGFPELFVKNLKKL